MKTSNLLLFIALWTVLTGCSKNGDPTQPVNNNSGTGTTVITPLAPVAKTVNTSSITSNNFTANWQKVTGADKYLVYVATDNQFQNTVTGYNPVIVTDTTVSVANLIAATNYYYRVQASENGVVSSYSNIIQVTTLAAKPAPTWQLVGVAGFSSGAVVYNTSLALDNSNVPYIAFQDASLSGAATVMKFSSGSWGTVGKAGFSNTNIGLISLAFDKLNNIPYVAYTDFAGHTTVQKFVSNAWSIVGYAEFVASEYQPSIAVYNGVPYVAVSDFGHGDLASVLKFNGSSWVFVGTEGFSGLNAVGNISLAFDTKGNPYVAYDSGGHGSIVEEFNGTNWIVTGNIAFNGSTAGYSSLAIDNNNNLYVGYSSSGGALPACMKYNGSYWGQLGTYFTGLDYYPAFTLDSSGNPYLVFQQNTDAYHSVSVMKYINGNWAAVGNTSFSGGYIGGTGSNASIYPSSIVVDANNVVYVAYADDNVNARATVMKFVQ